MGEARSAGRVAEEPSSAKARARQRLPPEHREQGSAHPTPLDHGCCRGGRGSTIRVLLQWGKTHVCNTSPVQESMLQRKLNNMEKHAKSGGHREDSSRCTWVCVNICRIKISPWWDSKTLTSITGRYNYIEHSELKSKLSCFSPKRRKDLKKISWDYCWPTVLVFLFVFLFCPTV